ncbi:hypothetical protein [Lacticaseibacillus yichunensis]|uniref:Head fiber protein n=1 Tax=Lacticaseibacillus yichunensis TaxID=2486015 RepID=A0ABW4CKD7_9LACO|nr:hypothetical protein [Lacticaseibacillus yichunensis]
MQVRLDTDAEGYINGWTGAEFADEGDTIVEVDTDAIVIGATKLVDGTLKIDEAKQAELYAPKPTTEQQLIASLSLRLAQLEAKS